MLPPRKLTFQLIPLLDLLLIVVFAQYLEGRIREERQAEATAAHRESLQRQLDEALRQLLALRETMAALEQRAQQADAQASELDRLRFQRDLIGEVVGEVFRVPEAMLEQVLRQRTAASPGPSADDVAQLKTRWQSLRHERADELVQHLLTFGEMRKRIDLWELHLRENGTCLLQAGSRRVTFRGETPEAFATRLFEAYKTLPEAKSMVLVLLTYGDAKFMLRKAVFDGLPVALERIRLDGGHHSRFEYAVLGYRPLPPTQ
jgi:hypothetical protein|uniref:Uncharacterized protein n=1 Tax=Schlesneria paludicola TaxID=360056 RepID=A0A7C4QTA2_9PLAN